MIAVFVLAIAATPFVDVTSSAAICAVQKQRKMFADFIANEKRELAHGGVMNKALVWHAQQLILKSDNGIKSMRSKSRAAGGILISCDDSRIEDVDECIFEDPNAPIERCEPARQFFSAFSDWYLDPPSLAGSDQ